MFRTTAKFELNSEALRRGLPRPQINGPGSAYLLAISQLLPVQRVNSVYRGFEKCLISILGSEIVSGVDARTYFVVDALLGLETKYACPLRATFTPFWCLT